MKWLADYWIIPAMLVVVFAAAVADHYLELEPLRIQIQIRTKVESQ